MKLSRLCVRMALLGIPIAAFALACRGGGGDTIRNGAMPSPVTLAISAPADQAPAIGSGGEREHARSLVPGNSGVLTESEIVSDTYGVAAGNGVAAGDGGASTTSAKPEWRLALAGDLSLTAGEQLVVTVTARDQFGNTVVTNEGAERFWYSLHGPRHCGGSLAFVSGVATVRERLTVPGEYNFLVRGPERVSGARELAPIHVTPGPATKFDAGLAFASEPEIVAGQPLGPFPVRVLDEFGNVATGYAGAAELVIGDHQVVPFEMTGGVGQIPVLPDGVHRAGVVDVRIRDTQGSVPPTYVNRRTVLPRRDPLGSVWAVVGKVTVRSGADPAAFPPFEAEVGDRVWRVSAQADHTLATPPGETNELGQAFSITAGSALPGADVAFQTETAGFSLPASQGFAPAETLVRAEWKGGKHDGRDLITGGTIDAIPFRAFRLATGAGDTEPGMVTFSGTWHAHLYRLWGISVDRVPPNGDRSALRDVTTPLSVAWAERKVLLCSVGETLTLHTTSNEPGANAKPEVAAPGTVAAETRWTVRNLAGAVVRDLGRGVTALNTSDLEAGRYQVCAALGDQDEPFVVDIEIAKPFLRLSIDRAAFNPTAHHEASCEVCGVLHVKGEGVSAGADGTAGTPDDVLLRSVLLTSTLTAAGGDQLLRIVPKMKDQQVGVVGLRPGRTTICFSAEDDPGLGTVDVPVSVTPMPEDAPFKVKADDGFDCADSSQPAPANLMITTTTDRGEEIVLQACYGEKAVPAGFRWAVEVLSSKEDTVVPEFDRTKPLTTFPRRESGTFRIIATENGVERGSVEVRIYGIRVESR
ncbi:MAG: hypothetical protein HY719_09680 [Planctomycetes bacterium]|nr:hypothetical protein [Planctomycetota bacterium]